MKRLVKALPYLLAPSLILLFVYRESVVAIAKDLNQNNEGFLLGVFKFLGYYFKDLEGWNIWFAIFLTAILMTIFIVTDYFTGKGISKIKHPKFQFLKKEWFNSTIQKLVIALFVGFLFTAASNAIIISMANDVTKSVDTVKKQAVLVLGTNKHLSSKPGAENLYFSYRIDKAVELYNAGKATRFIVSGDKTDSLNYDETIDMKESLVSAGIPDHMIQRDTAGYRTLDSMLRLRSLFGLDSVTIVTQAFHSPRANFLAWFYGMHPTIVNADGSATNSMLVREFQAKPLVILDLFIFNMQPKASKHSFRKEYAINTELDAWMVLSGVIGLAFIFAAMVNVLDKNAKGVWKKLAIGTTSTAFAIICLLSVYENSDIVDGIVETVADATGVGTGLVDKKKERKQKIEETKEKIKQIREDRTTEIKRLDSISVAQEKIDSMLIANQAKEELTQEVAFASFSVNKTPFKEVKEPEQKITEAKEPEQKESVFGTFSNNDNSPSSFNNSSSNEKLEVLFPRTLLVQHDTKIQLKVAENTTINGKVFRQNESIDGIVIISGNTVAIKIKVNDKEAFVLDENNNRQLSEKAYRRDRNGFIISTKKTHYAKI